MSDKLDLESLVQLYADFVVAYGKACEAGLNYADSDEWENPLVEPSSKPCSVGCIPRSLSCRETPRPSLSGEAKDPPERVETLRIMVHETALDAIK
jgi:hypothetical protein